jgi:hypothetical protein
LNEEWEERRMMEGNKCGKEFITEKENLFGFEKFLFMAAARRCLLVSKQNKSKSSKEEKKISHFFHLGEP